MDEITVKIYRKGKIKIADCIYNKKKEKEKKKKKKKCKMRVGGCQIPKNESRVGVANCLYFSKRITQK